MKAPTVLLVAAILTVPAAASDADSPRCPPAQDDARGLLACGEQAIDRGKPKKGTALLQRALELTEKLEPGHPLQLRVLSQLVRVANDRRDFDGMAGIWRDALERLDTRVGADHPARIHLLSSLADAVAISDSPEAGVPYARKAVEIAEIHDDDQRGVDRLAGAARRLGWLLTRAGDTDGAIATFRRIADLYGWEAHSRLLGVAGELARLEAREGRVDEAARAYDLALRSNRLHYGAGSSRLQQLVDELTELGRRHDRPDLVARAAGFAEQDARELTSLEGAPADPDVIHVSGQDGVTQPKRRRYVPPQYPAKGRTQRVEGNVVMRIVVLADGTVGSIEILRCSNPGYGFEEASRRAVRQWTFEPATRDGRPVAAYFTVSTSFAIQ